MFKVHVDHGGVNPVVKVSGELDILSSIALRQCFETLQDEVVTLDCSGLTFCDSSGLSIMLWKHRHGGIILRGVQPAQMRLLKITNLDSVLPVEDSPHG